MAPKVAPLATWPWDWAESHKYVLFVPIGFQCLWNHHHGQHPFYNVHFHILLISALRCTLYQTWHFLSRLNFVSKHCRIQDDLVSFDQVDRECNWDNYLILQALVATAWQACAAGPFAELSLMNWKGLLLLTVIHVGPCEFLYYCVHRCFHRIPYLYDSYHHLHHASTRPEPSTAGTGTFFEHLLLTALMLLPLGAVMYVRLLSIGVLYLYILGFDFMRFMIHSNLEVMPLLPFKLFPVLRLFLITPSYHSLHHSSRNSNYCLFMPLYDYLGGTFDSSAFKVHELIRTEGRKEVVPDFVFLPHGVGLVSVLHIGVAWRTFASHPCNNANWFAYPFIPFVIIGSIPMWLWAKSYVLSDYILEGVHQQTWGMATYGFQYFIPSMRPRINELLEDSILKADKMGVKVVALGALNKSEVLNEGGLLVVEKLKDLSVRVCHGNTLTTAVLLHQLPEDVSEVFLTGSTSKIGKAIAVYLCKKHVKVLMLTASQERFEAVLKEAPKECKQYLVWATKYQAGQHCKTWIIGKMAGYHAQQRAPSGCHFHQFTMPSIFHFRKDCTYYDSIGVRLPENGVIGLNTCEYTMPRFAVHACHAGGLLHALEGWQHHEVGSVDVNQIDFVWEAAMKHGFRPA